MTWIETIPYEDATGRLRQLYDRVKGPDDHVDNIMAAHSLRPHTMDGHMAMYKNVLHHSSNVTPTWFLEVVGVLVSQINGCGVCLEGHGRRARADGETDERLTTIAAWRETPYFTDAERAALALTEAVTIK